MNKIKNEVVERFLRYIAIDTQSDESSKTHPSTLKQRDLAILLNKELTDLGLEDIELDDNGYLMATLSANYQCTNQIQQPVIGLIAHMDTSPDFNGKCDYPQIIENYNGSDIELDSEKRLFLSTSKFPELLKYKDQTLITTRGNSLLGADDKAGIAEIMTSISFLKAHPEIKHHKIRIAFTIDEEIGRGADLFDVQKFSADYAYTIDGGEIGELEYENFNAAVANVSFSGHNVHPGFAKDKMINSIQLAIEFNNSIPVNERPEFTEKYEGFYHIIDFSGNVEKTTLKYIIRDHDYKKFELKKNFLLQIAEFINKKYGEQFVAIEIKDQYFNMKEKILPVYHIVEKAKQAMIKAGVVPNIKPVRGGTDGARLSFMGIPTPNIFAGGHNFHGKYEFIPVESMVKAVEVIVNLVTCEN